MLEQWISDQVPHTLVKETSTEALRTCDGCYRDWLDTQAARFGVLPELKSELELQPEPESGSETATIQPNAPKPDDRSSVAQLFHLFDKDADELECFPCL